MGKKAAIHVMPQSGGETAPITRPKIGLALGAGGARGWAHIGVLQALRGINIEPDIVAGTSVGALVGAVYCMDRLDDFEDWVAQLRWRDVMAFFDISLSGGFIEGKKLFDFLKEYFLDNHIEHLAKPYAAVATRWDNGHEVWLREGSVLDAARASLAVPGFFNPVLREGRWLLDGGLVNPVPVSVCRVLGADVVIAVAVSSRSQWALRFAGERNQAKTPVQTKASISDSLVDKITHMLRQGAASIISRSKVQSPSVFDVVADSIEIMQARVMRSRMAGDPPDVLIEPFIPEVRFLEFHRGREAIDAGRKAVDDVMHQLKALKVAR